MGVFRDRMERDLKMKGMSPKTCRDYLGSVKRFVRYYGKPPDQLGIEDVRAFLFHLTNDRKLSRPSFNMYTAALRFFYRVTLKVDWDFDKLRFQKLERRLPEILSREEIVALLAATHKRKPRAILMTIYSGGLRISETCGLRVSDIDSQRMVIHVRGKGNKDRFVMLSKRLLEVLRDYWREHRPSFYLFPGRDPKRPITAVSVQRYFRKARKIAGIRKKVSVHSLRHAFATHLLESGQNILTIKRLLGHRSLTTTEIYVHLAKDFLNKTPSPLDDLLPLEKAPSSTG